MGAVVDTNVAVVASGLAAQADIRCVTACMQRLYAIQQHGGLLLDDRGEILLEYTKKLGYSGQPGAGHAFVKWAFDNQANAQQVRRVSITPRGLAGWRRFDEFPDVPALRGFDPSDQKFVAVAIASGEGPAILNAVDSDWWHHRAALEAAGVSLEFLCLQHAPER
jgi:hypothetical protein